MSLCKFQNQNKYVYKYSHNHINTPYRQKFFAWLSVGFFKCRRSNKCNYCKYKQRKKFKFIIRGVCTHGKLQQNICQYYSYQGSCVYKSVAFVAYANFLTLWTFYPFRNFFCLYFSQFFLV